MPIELDNTFLGAMTENYVAQVFSSKGYDLFYWQSEGKAEVDFVLQLEYLITTTLSRRHKWTSLHYIVFTSAPSQSPHHQPSQAM
jgi:predicted AAA+ superfamily ATPase